MTYIQKLSFEDYLALDNTGSEELAELIDGELVELLPESGINLGIAACVYLELIRIGVPFLLISMGRCEVQTPVLVPEDAANRFPDVVVLREDHCSLTQQFTLTARQIFAVAE